MWLKQTLTLILALLLAAGGCMEIPEHSVCASGLICPPHLQCAAAQDICIAGPCGNGIIESSAGETCDDGNIDPDDGCDQECRSEVITMLALGGSHTCALSEEGNVRCWGAGALGKLGYGNTDNIGDNEAPASAGNIDVGGKVIQIAAGGEHTCALLATGTVRCWGYGYFGALGYGNIDNIGDDEVPASAGDVDIGGTVLQITAGSKHTCALLDSGTVRCWGHSDSGTLGYGNTDAVGDNEVPASVGDVDLGGTVLQIAAGSTDHTCALLDSGVVRCWGHGYSGRLGYGNTDNIGDNETPASVGDVDVGGSVIQIAAGGAHTCALLDSDTVRCWGTGFSGQLGYGTTNSVETPATAGDVNVGGTVIQLATGGAHTCALLDSGEVRCWGYGYDGRLGYGNTSQIGDNETPASAGDVNVGGKTIQIDAGAQHTCALLDSGAIRCWGDGYYGQLGYGNRTTIGDDEVPASVSPVTNTGAIIPGTAGFEYVGPLLDASAAHDRRDDMSAHPGHSADGTLRMTRLGDALHR